jgi:hypothetical protein
MHDVGLPAASDRGFQLQVLGWFEGSPEPQLLLATGSGGAAGGNRSGGDGGTPWLALDGDPAYAASPVCGISYNCMYPFEHIDGRRFPIGWETPEFDATGAGWLAPVLAGPFRRALKAKYTAAVRPLLYTKGAGGDSGSSDDEELDRGEHPAVAVTEAVAHVNSNLSSPLYGKYDANTTGREVTVFDVGTVMDAGIRIRIVCSNSSSGSSGSGGGGAPAPADCANSHVALEYGDVLFPDGSVRWATQGATHDREIWTLREGSNDLRHLEYRTWRCETQVYGDWNMI